MKILIVDDEEMIRGVLKEYVEFEGNEAFEASDGMEAVRMCKDNDYDVVLMDVMMPRLDGFSAVKEIRKFKDVPVIMLSARGEEYDKLFGFEIGADDYVTKPFSPKEVMARINAVTKRRAANTADASAQTYKFEGLEIDMAGRNVYVDGEKAELTPKEYELLFYLVRNKGIALTREKLLYDVWGFDFYGDDRTVDTHIKMLRGNLKDYRKFIVTLRGLGYKFEVDSARTSGLLAKEALQGGETVFRAARVCIFWKKRRALKSRGRRWSMKGRMTQKNYAKGQGSTSIYFLLWAAFSVFALIIVLLFALTQNLLLKQTYKDEITKSLAMNGTAIQKELNDYRGPNYSSFVRYQAALYDVGVYILGADGSVMFPIEEELDPSDPVFGEHMDFSEKVKRLRNQLT